MTIEMKPTPTPANTEEERMTESERIQNELVAEVFAVFRNHDCPPFTAIEALASAMTSLFLMTQRFNPEQEMEGEISSFLDLIKTKIVSQCPIARANPLTAPK